MISVIERRVVNACDMAKVVSVYPSTAARTCLAHDSIAFSDDKQHLITQSVKKTGLHCLDVAQAPG